MLERLGFNVRSVEAQNCFDGNFPTVDSPNPENAAALRLGLELAEKERADLVIATDPDCDRMGVAVRATNGKMELLTGNQIGSLLAYYRTRTLFELGILNEKNASRAVIIKTFVTTDLQKAIAEHYGLRCVETLTGFKYIGAKLRKYEEALPPDVQQKYRDLPEEETRRLRLEQSQGSAGARSRRNALRDDQCGWSRELRRHIQSAHEWNRISGTARIQQHRRRRSRAGNRRDIWQRRSALRRDPIRRGRDQRQHLSSRYRWQ